MSADKPTTGPLEVGYYSTTDAFRAIHQHAAVMRPDRSLVAVTGPSTGKGAWEALEYAQLFAAAPALLDALGAMVDAFPVPVCEFYGQSNGFGEKHYCSACHQQEAHEAARAAIALAESGVTTESETVRVPAENLGDLTGTKFGERLARHAARKKRGAR